LLNPQFGKGNAGSAVIHMDEETLHLYARVIPIVMEKLKKAKVNDTVFMIVIDKGKLEF